MGTSDLTLNNGVVLPSVGYDVYRTSAEETKDAISEVIAIGTEKGVLTQAWSPIGGVVTHATDASNPHLTINSVDDGSGAASLLPASRRRSVDTP